MELLRTVADVRSALGRAPRPVGVVPTIGAFHAGHVALFNIVQPDTVHFGQKDAQQVEVVRRMLRDLNVPIRLSVQPTLRDPDGLAMSSRNVRLSPAAREQALALPRALATKDPVKARAM